MSYYIIQAIAPDGEIKFVGNDLPVSADDATIFPTWGEANAYINNVISGILYNYRLYLADKDGTRIFNPCIISLYDGYENILGYVGEKDKFTTFIGESKIFNGYRPASEYLMVTLAKKYDQAWQLHVCDLEGNIINPHHQ